MADYAFIFETDEVRKKRIKTLLVLLTVILIGSTIVIAGSHTGLVTLPSLKELTDVSSFSPSPEGLFAIAAAGGIFFITIPLEVVFFSAITKGAAQVASVAGIVTGFLVGNIISYLLGWKLSSIFVHLISPKKIYDLRRWVGKHGGAAVFLCNVLPLPAPILTFGLGIARYNMTRLFVLLIIANIIKYSILAAGISLFL